MKEVTGFYIVGDPRYKRVAMMFHDRVCLLTVEEARAVAMSLIEEADYSDPKPHEPAA